MKTVKTATCKHCQQVKNLSELNGYDVLSNSKDAYKDAYCRNLLSCNSSHANNLVSKIIHEINNDDDF